MAKTVSRTGYGISADSNNWRLLRNAFLAVTISDFTVLGGNAAAPAASLTGMNAVGPYASLLPEPSRYLMQSAPAARWAAGPDR